MEGKNVSISKKLSYSGIVMALYIVVVFATQSFSFGQYQIRIATALYALAFYYPFLVVPLALGNMLSNLLMGGLGVFDIVGGFLIGLITSGSIVLLKRVTDRAVFLVLPIALAPALIVPVWLSTILKVPYFVLVLSLLVGQVISAYTLGLYIIKGKWIQKLLNQT